MQSADMKAKFHDADSVMQFYTHRKAKKEHIQNMSQYMTQVEAVGVLMANHGYEPNNN